MMMAYLRKDKHLIESDYSFPEIWEEIPIVIEEIGWKLGNIDEKNQQIRASTIGGMLSYASLLVIKVWSTNNKKTRIEINSETPVTTITSITDFGRIRQRVDLFFEALSIKLDNKKISKKTPN
jgi:hypothetical protein